MKKLILLVLAMGFFASSYAYDYPWLTFQSSDGTETPVSVEGLSMSVSNGSLIATNADGSQTFELSKLSKMFFSSSTTGISQISGDTTQQVEVYTTAGISLGKFSDASQTYSSLRPGLYIIKTDKGTFKMAKK